MLLNNLSFLPNQIKFNIPVFNHKGEREFFVSKEEAEVLVRGRIIVKKGLNNYKISERNIDIKYALRNVDNEYEISTKLEKIA